MPPNLEIAAPRRAPGSIWMQAEDMKHNGNNDGDEITKTQGK
jgi:hypothetical protein